ncbi:PREDICTED: mucin-2-like, partial [Colobus angolensis palliatus]|uniref:mucin-2-like n=1 Tax=Colobus angolensis palliatus TaxID=336983 RepID=UPI0005F4F275
MDTCSHLEGSSLCEEHRMDGCFCPEGTVFDDIRGGGCVPVSQCHCRLHGHLYTPGQEITNDCEQCVCNAGRWVCKDLPCPGTCALEGGSHITTFDGKTYTFHGDCYYVLAKVGCPGDDFKTASGLVEATGAGFANTWKAQSSCHDKLDWLDDPCSLNIESANYAEHWCSLLKNTETSFGRCHSVVDPAEYYKRCKYDTCNCQNNEDCLCAALSSYARACAAKGVMLWGWRDGVCNKDVGSCPNSQVFLYNLTTCQQTCRSLSEADSHCLEGFAPVDGCGCPDHTFLDEKGRCVPLAKCSCYHRGLYLEAGDVVVRQEER